ncbi:hypothetical protein AB0K16_52485 [Nonomuraea jabiensis]|uniref:hypothetical protein n=1 Tax=Nonomuraea jabiensis TaxID=882448 RepID=UPI00343BF426
MLDLLRPIPGLLLDLPRNGRHRILAGLDQPAGKLSTPPAEHEPVPPPQQHPSLLIHDDSDGSPIQLHHMMLEPLCF